MLDQGLGFIFDPKSVAIAGVSAKQMSSGGMGQRYFRSMLDYGFKGRVYPLNPKGGEIDGLRLYANIKDISEPVDYVISCIPAPAGPQLMKDCIAKGVKVVHFYTSGFSEIGTEERRKLEEEIRTLAKASGIRIIGPNCLGVYCPKSNFTFHADFPRESGPVALVCQSGGISTYLIREAAKRGVRFSKVVSYGNAADIDETDLLDYLAHDPDTRIILAYIEGVKNGRKFGQVLKEAARAKPVIVIKGGVTESGARSAASHTGALAGSNETWDALLHQVGAIRVSSLEELIDMAVTFSYLSLPRGRRVGIMGIGGGLTVLATDECGSAGLVVPRLPQHLCEELSDLVKDEAGTILNNPMDISAGAWESGYYRALEILTGYEDIDFAMVHIALGPLSFPLSWYDQVWNSLIEDIAKFHKESAKPVMVIIHQLTSDADYKWMFEAQKRCSEAGLPVYHSIGSAVRSFDRFYKYSERNSGCGS